MHSADDGGNERLRGFRAWKAERLLHALLPEQLVRGVLRLGDAVRAYEKQVAGPQADGRLGVRNVAPYAERRKAAAFEPGDALTLPPQSRRDVPCVAVA